jgi:hypothetical protein
VTFGGARTAALNGAPLSTAKKSIYTFIFQSQPGTAAAVSKRHGGFQVCCNTNKAKVRDSNPDAGGGPGGVTRQIEGGIHELLKLPKDAANGSDGGGGGGAAAANRNASTAAATLAYDDYIAGANERHTHTNCTYCMYACMIHKHLCVCACV